MLRCPLCCHASPGPLWTTFLGHDRPHKNDRLAPIRSRSFPRAICFDLLQSWKKRAVESRWGPWGSTGQGNRVTRARGFARGRVDQVGHVVRQTLSYREEAKPSSPVSLADVVDEVLATRHEKLRTAALEKRYDSSCFVKASQVELHQLVSNLIVNAMESLPESKGSIKVRLLESRNWRDGDRRGVRIVVAEELTRTAATASLNRFLRPNIRKAQAWGYR